MARSADQIRAMMAADAASHGFFLCPDAELLGELMAGEATNDERYGYLSCPCRLASGAKTFDADIICPCEYRDADVAEHGMCFCGLFVSEEVSKAPGMLHSIPERRPKEVIDAALDARDRLERGEKVEEDEEGHAHVQVGVDAQGVPIWRCTVCGYLAARERPPAVCPICKAKSDRFERFGMGHRG